MIQKFYIPVLVLFGMGLLSFYSPGERRQDNAYQYPHYIIKSLSL